MRTVTFSDAAVVKALNEQVACAWINKAPDKKFRDGMYAHLKEPMRLSPGTGTDNVTAVFAAPDGTVIHAMPGYLGAESFLRHLEYARALHARLYDPGVKREDRAGIYAEAHAKSAKEISYYLEKEAHDLLAPRFMRVDEFSLKYFDGLARRGG